MDCGTAEAIKEYFFYKGDTNGDGFLTRTDLHEVFKAIRCHLSEEDIDTMFSAFDTGGVGRVLCTALVDWIADEVHHGAACAAAPQKKTAAAEEEEARRMRGSMRLGCP
mmetsp:Transcript_148966/g.371161  ORF Transcript_148966/g.371161 Transcript_148966/m.371161 type:complete len:109 (+) Transcript_148966:80-406(+)